MPDQEGLETIMEIKRDYPHIKVLAISGGGKLATGDYLSMAGRLGADFTLRKPFFKQELLDAVQELFEGK